MEASLTFAVLSLGKPDMGWSWALLWTWVSAEGGNLLCELEYKCVQTGCCNIHEIMPPLVSYWPKYAPPYRSK